MIVKRFIRRRLAAALLLLLCAAAGAQAGPVRVAFHDTTVTGGSSVDYPIYVDSSLTGLNVTAYQIEFTVPSGALTLVSASATGTLSESWGAPMMNEVSPGRIRLAAAGSVPLAGKGVLATIRIATQPRANYLGFQFQSIVLNEGGIAAAGANATVTTLQPSVISVYPSNGELAIGEALQFSASQGTAPYAWSVTNSSVASIDASGKLTGIGIGTTRVVAVDKNGIADTTDNVITVRGMRLYVRDTTRYMGQTLSFPVYVTDLTGLGITSGQFTLSFNSSLLSVEGVSEIGTILSAVGQPTYAVNNGHVTISFASTAPISGAGVLVFVKFRLSTLQSGYSSMSMQNGLFNQDLVAISTSTSYALVQSLATLSISPYGSNTIIAGDSIQYSASGGVTPYTWSVSDTSIAKVTATGMVTGKKGGIVNVTAVDAVGGSGTSGQLTVYDFKVTLPDSTANANGTYDLPIRITAQKTGFVSFEGTITYPASSYLVPASVITTGTLTEGWSVASSLKPGEAKIAAAGTLPVTAGGVLLKVRFAVPDSAPRPNSIAFSLASPRFDEGKPVPFVTNGTLSLTQKKPALTLVQKSFDFGQVKKNQWRDMVVPIANTGNDTLKITSITSTNAVFSSLAGVIKIAPGASFPDSVRFAPAAIATYSGFIIIASNSPSSPDTVRVNGVGTAPDAVADNTQAPGSFALFQNYPNPFNPSTTIEYRLAEPSMVRLTVFDQLGREAAVLAEGYRAGGIHRVTFDGSAFASGLYYYRLRAGSHTETRKFILSK